MWLGKCFNVLYCVILSHWLQFVAHWISCSMVIYFLPWPTSIYTFILHCLLPAFHFVAHLLIIWIDSLSGRLLCWSEVCKCSNCESRNISFGRNGFIYFLLSPIQIYYCKCKVQMFSPQQPCRSQVNIAYLIVESATLLLAFLLKPSELLGRADLPCPRAASYTFNLYSARWWHMSSKGSLWLRA